MDIRTLQDEVNRRWSLQLDNPCHASADANHALVHLAKALGKVASAVNDAEHERRPLRAEEVEKYLADLVICSARFANGLVDLDGACALRLFEKFPVEGEVLPHRGEGSPSAEQTSRGLAADAAHRSSSVTVSRRGVRRPRKVPMDVEMKELNLDGLVDEEKGVRYIGQATRRPNGQWVCLADVMGCLCLVELRVALNIRGGGR